MNRQDFQTVQNIEMRSVWNFHLSSNLSCRNTDSVSLIIISAYQLHIFFQIFYFHFQFSIAPSILDTVFLRYQFLSIVDYDQFCNGQLIAIDPTMNFPAPSDSQSSSVQEHFCCIYIFRDCNFLEHWKNRKMLDHNFSQTSPIQVINNSNGRIRFMASF